MCSRLFHAGIEYVVEDGRLKPRPEPDVELRDRFVEAAILGNAAHLRENDGAPEAFARNYGRTYEAAVLESDVLRAVVVPEMGGRIFSMEWKERNLDLMHTDDLVRIVNYMPCHCGYEFSVEPEWKGPGTEEAYETLEQDTAHVALRADVGRGLTVTTHYSVRDGEVTVRHTVANAGGDPVEVAPFTHPEWNYEVFGPEAELAMRTPDGSWRTMELNPEDRSGRDLPFGAEEMPAGAWRLASSVHPMVLEEEFDAEAVSHTRLNLSARNGNVNLELHFQPVTIAPGEECAFWTRWRITPR